MPSPLPKDELPGKRSRLVVIASTVYAAAASLRAAEGRTVKGWALAMLGLAIASWTASRDRGMRVTTWGLAIAIASLGAPIGEAGAVGAGGPGWPFVFAVTGAAAATAAARFAIARVSAPPGLAFTKPSSPVPGLALLTAAWGLAIATASASALDVKWALATRARECAQLAAILGGLVLLGETLLAAHVRRLELGVAARMRAAAALLGALAAIAWALWFTNLVSPEASALSLIAVASVLLTAVMLHGDPVAIARLLRRAIALVVIGGPLLMLGATAADGRPWDGAVIVAIVGVLAISIGAGAPVLEEPLRPERGAWLDAVERAHEALLRTDPDEAVREALVALRLPAGATAMSPELWTFDPVRVTTVDAAGYAHERESALQASLVETTADEPEATLRAEVLQVLEVRRPELRPLGKWLADREAMLATVVTRAGEAEGLLVLPRGARTQPLSLEEARAIKRLADALAALCHARAALARSLAREREAVLRAEAAEDKLARVEHEMDVHVGRHALAAARLARPATVGVYAAASRMAFDAIERRTRAGTPIAVVAPSGVDPVPYIARAHLGGPRSAAPLVLVDGTSSREHDLARWTDPHASPIALADRGLLVLLDGAALPLDVQRLVARALTERRPPWERAEPLDIAIALTATSPPARLVTGGRLDATLAARFGDEIDTPIALPRLRDRPEDIRAIVTDRLAREGLRVKGMPVGIDDAAFGVLVNYAFPGEDAELSAIVQRLVARCTGEVVRKADVDALTLEREERGEDEHAPRRKGARG